MTVKYCVVTLLLVAVTLLFESQAAVADSSGKSIMINVYKYFIVGIIFMYTCKRNCPTIC